MKPIPDWQLPDGVDRGLWDYFHSREMVANYDKQMTESALAASDVAYCVRHFPTPGRIIDLGCGTGRLAAAFAERGDEYLGVDLSSEMLAVAEVKHTRSNVRFLAANLVQLPELEPFDYAACLFSTLGMVRGVAERQRVLDGVARVLKPRGRFVLHVHNRWFAALGWKRFLTADHTMAQAYGGAPLTLHHFSLREVRRMLRTAGFAIVDETPVRLPNERAIYGYLLAAERIRT
jgi:SAM-dependent methyltransferase